MPDGVRFSLLGVVVVSVNVMVLVAWYYLRARRLKEKRGDIGLCPVPCSAATACHGHMRRSPLLLAS